MARALTTIPAHARRGLRAPGLSERAHRGFAFRSGLLQPQRGLTDGPGSTSPNAAARMKIWDSMATNDHMRPPRTTTTMPAGESEIAMYRLAAEETLKQLDWCVAYLYRSRKPRVANSIATSRSAIRRRMSRPEG
jgi:hypothetical protein